VEFLEHTLSDPNYAKLASCPFLLCMIVSVIDAPVTQFAVHAARDSTTATSLPPPKSSLKKRKTNKGDLKTEPDSTAQKQQVSVIATTPTATFKDKPSMFEMATRMIANSCDVSTNNSNIENQSLKIEPRGILTFLQKLAWFCHSRYTIDITSGQVVEFLQFTSGGINNAAKKEFSLGQQYRQIWNFLTNMVKSAQKFELLVSSTAMKPGLAANGEQQVETIYQFSHISFQEYFCSMELLEKIQDEVNNNVSGIEACKRIFLNNNELKGNSKILHNFWWNNVIFCAANAAPTWLFKVRERAMNETKI